MLDRGVVALLFCVQNSKFKFNPLYYYTSWRSFGGGNEVFEAFARPLYILTWNTSFCTCSIFPKTNKKLALQVYIIWFQIVRI
jgi:hypothetical protein